MKETHSYSATEKLLILLAIFVFAVMSYAYVADISIKALLFPSTADLMHSTPIGKVTAKSGTLLRQRAKEFEFKPLQIGDDLYLDDTLMTGPESTAGLELAKSGQKFDMKENSLIKLSFGSDFNVSGVVRIEILKTAKKEEETQAPLTIANFQPAERATLSFSAEDFLERKKVVRVAFTTNRPSQRLTIHLYLPEDNGQQRRELTSIAPKIENLDVAASFTFNTPGSYEWEVHDSNGRVLAKHSFTIGRRVQIIEALPTLNSSNRLEGLSTKKEFEGFVLRWRPVQGQGPYTIQVFKPNSDRIVLQKQLTSTELVLNKNNLLLGQLTFAVERDLGGGFVGWSGRHEFGFAFLPPALTAPANGAVYDGIKLEETNHLMFFTWQKTNYTEGYEFHLAKDPGFTRMVIKHQLRDNYYSFNAPPIGQYYWRVRAIAHGMFSDFSQARSLTLSP